MIPASFKCDGSGCHAVRTETNHWWLIQLGRVVEGRYRPYADGAFMVTPWGDFSAEQEGHLHLCGQECLLKKVAEIVSKQSTIPAPKTSPVAVKPNEDKTE